MATELYSLTDSNGVTGTFVDSTARSDIATLKSSIGAASSTGYAIISSANKRYIHGKESVLADLLWEYDDTSVDNLTTIHVDDFTANINGTYVTVAAQDLTLSPDDVGVNYYVEVDTSGNLTIASGRTDSNSQMCIGGFHYGVVRISTTIADVSNGIVPNSIWTLNWRPDCKCPDAMVYLGNHLWGDIYLTACATSCSSYGIDGVVTECSQYGVVPATGTENFNQYGFVEALNKVGKRLPCHDEFLRAADGSPSGLDSSNTNAWTNTSNSARTSCGAVPYACSSLNVRDLVGNVWKWCSDKSEMDRGSTSYAWISTSSGKGDTYGAGTYGMCSLRAGGSWDFGSHCGSRAVTLNAWPWYVNTDSGAWAVASAL